jgi:CheY-like chemotaxis protein/anti-sigma regulatory factor (Ser/Thr protein kinase)
MSDAASDAPSVNPTDASMRIGPDGRSLLESRRASAMRRVLAIRPEPQLVTMLGAVLDSSRQQLEFCGGSAETIKRVRDQPIDVVITDPATSVHEDLALVSELRNLRPALRIIVLSPAASPADVVDAIRANVFACFTSPFDYDEIASMAANALGADNWGDGIHVISGLPHWLTLRASCHLLTADRLVRFMSELQSQVPGDRDLLITAFREMLLNAMEHGGGFDPDKVIEVTAARTARAIVYHFRDPGMGFDMSSLESVAAATSHPEVVLATAQRRAEVGLRPGGFGMLIVRNIVDELVYNERGNEVILVKHLS